MGEISLLCGVFSFFVPQILRMPRAQTTQPLLCNLIRRASVPGYCIPKGTKL